MARPKPEVRTLHFIGNLWIITEGSRETLVGGATAKDAIITYCKSWRRDAKTTDNGIIDLLTDPDPVTVRQVTNIIGHDIGRNK